MSIYSDKFIFIYCMALAVIVGAVLGSFLNCVAMRIVRKESFLKGRSHCPKCGHVLGIPDLIPLFSWIFLRGKCRHCGEKVSARYPVTEAVMSVVTAVLLLRCDLSILFLRNLIFSCLLFVLSLVDYESYEIPNITIILGIVVWAAFLPLMDSPMDALKSGVIAALVFGVGILAISVLLDIILKKDSLGGGDIKLIFVAGLYLGVVPSLFMMIIACFTGLIFAAALRKVADGKPFPFGPAISIATFLMMLFGQTLADWYLALF